MKLSIHIITFLFCLSLQAQHLNDSTELESFMDGVINTLLVDEHIAGATLAIVHDGKIILKKGYGFADYEHRIPVDPDKSMFRIGSITKMFVWTSVMKLVAEGKLDLNADINTYLKDFKVPDGYDQPITLTHLLTHTPGFEDRVLGLFALDSTSLLPLGEILEKEMPERIRPPFTQASYSNHGTGIAAYIVEQVTGMPFYEYAEQQFIKPLEMEYTSLRQPLPATLKNYMSNGYKYSKEFEQMNFEYVPLYPVGAASASANDMTHWMLAYLQHGRYNNYQLIDSATLVRMRSEVKRHHPQVNPMLLGFMDISMNDVKVFGHGGDTFWFHSLMALIPDHNVGFFISFNTNTGGGAYEKAFRSFMNRYFPDSTAWEKPIDVTPEWLNKFSGEYEINRYPHSDITKISSLFGRISVTGSDHKLAVSSPQETKYFVPIDSTTFREEFSNEKLAFELDGSGNVIHAYDRLFAIFAFDKVSFIKASQTHTLVFAVVMIVSLFTVLYWPFVALARKNYVRGSRTKQPLSFPSRLIAWMNYFLVLVFITGLISSLGEPEDLVYGISGSLKALLVIPIILIFTTAGMIIAWIGIVQHKVYSMRSRIFYALLCLVSLVALWQLNYWNFIGFNY
jgi:CubicO group peptidase (beta-lactamase class C family)